MSDRNYARDLQQVLFKQQGYTATDIQTIRETLHSAGVMNQPTTFYYTAVRTNVELLDAIGALERSIGRFDESSTRLATKIYVLTWVYTVVAVFSLAAAVLAILR